MSLPVQINMLATTAGDKWHGIPTIGPVLIRENQDDPGTAPSFPLSRVRMQFRRNGQLGMTLDSNGSGDYPIQISNAATWLVHFPEIQPLPLGAGIWQTDVEFWEGTDTAPQTFYKATLIVAQDITR